MVEFKHYQDGFAKQHVDLIWEVTDDWKYEYQTSYETINKAYSKDGFDPKSRIYAFDGDKMIGFVGVNITKNEEKGDFGLMRLPIAVNDDLDISSQLMEKIENYLVSLENLGLLPSK